MVLEFAVERRRHDGAGRDAEPQIGQAQARLAARRLQQIVEHGRHAGEVGEFAALEQPHRFAGREPLHDEGAGAGREDAEHRQIQRVGMKQRQRREHRVALGKTGDRRPAGGDDPQHAMHRELHALGAAGGARGVENERRSRAATAGSRGADFGGVRHQRLRSAAPSRRTGRDRSRSASSRLGADACSRANRSPRSAVVITALQLASVSR